MLLRYLREEETIQALQEAHSGVCGSHQSGPKLHFHLKRMGYYLPTMVKDCLYYARKCDVCQFHANFKHQSPEVLHPTIASWSFDAWGLDIVGPLQSLPVDTCTSWLQLITFQNGLKLSLLKR